MAEINVVPYIDVMLVLLVIFMITAPMLQQGVEIDLPVASAKPIEETQTEPLIVEVDAGGNYFLSINQPPNVNLSTKELMIKTAAYMRRNPDAQVLVRGDKDVPYGKVVSAMVKLKDAGVPKVGLMTQSGEEQ
ncbi:MAG: protein TolR [Gammaproteobacteria bacterium]|nr:MAG: protein TolR [Gammaproteobacteria bacterium]